MLFAMLAIIAAAVIAVPQLEEGLPQILGWLGGLVLAGVAVWALRPSPRRHARWRR